MPTQKVFKQRVRSRMAKTGESYTAARLQLVRKSTETTAAHEPLPIASQPEPDPALFGVPDDSMLERTGRRHAEWFALLDEWGATSRGHTEIARWLGSAHGVPGWWTQSITVSYERARGMRARHQMADGYSIGATRSIATTVDAVLQAFTDPATRDAWLPDAPLRSRPTRAARTARFDWLEPASRLVVTVVERPAGKVAVTATHERIQDASDAARLKAAWRTRLGELKELLERG